MGYVIAILIVITAGWALIVGRRLWLERRDAELTETSGGEWRFLDTGRPSRVGPRAAEVLARARSMIVSTAMFAVLVESRGARSDEVQRFAPALSKALVADAGTSSTDC